MRHQWRIKRAKLAVDSDLCLPWWLILKMEKASTEDEDENEDEEDFTPDG